MNNKSFAKAVLLDLLASVLATGAVALADAGTHIFSDMRQAFLFMALLYVAAGFARGAFTPPNAWLKALLLISVCFVALGLASDAPPAWLLPIAVTSYAASLAGIYARRSWTINRKRSIATVLTVLAVIAIGSVFGAPVLATRLATHAANTAAPNFSVVRLDGAALNSSEFKGRVAVLDFWATWCPPCRRELPELDKLYQRYQGNPNVRFLAIAVNQDGETAAKARSFIEKAGYTIPIAYDATGEAVTRLKAQGYPHLLLLDKAGHVRLEHVGYDLAEPLVENLSKEINKLLREPSTG